MLVQQGAIDVVEVLPEREQDHRSVHRPATLKQQPPPATSFLPEPQDTLSHHRKLLHPTARKSMGAARRYFTSSSTLRGVPLTVAFAVTFGREDQLSL